MIMVDLSLLMNFCLFHSGSVALPTSCEGPKLRSIQGSKGIFLEFFFSKSAGWYLQHIVVTCNCAFRCAYVV